jgi:hypothetical protein
MSDDLRGTYDDQGYEHECLDERGEQTCRGPLQYRMALSGTGKSFVRCDKHWGDRLAMQDKINNRYPDSEFAPSDFDPTYAGERWNDD